MSSTVKSKGYEMPQALAQQIINYLSLRPFNEVEPLIGGMRQMKEVDIEVSVPGLQAVPDSTETPSESNGKDRSAEA